MASTYCYVQPSVGMVHGVLIETFGERSLGQIPIRVHWYTGDCCSDNGRDATSYADGHGDIYRHPGPFEGKDSPILEQD